MATSYYLDFLRRSGNFNLTYIEGVGDAVGFTVGETEVVGAAEGVGLGEALAVGVGVSVAFASSSLNFLAY